jgi:tetratricopeptide (TPR) repeat protein
MAYSDEDEDIIYLVKDFSDKIKNRESFIFYDSDEWLDIIDYFFLEENNEYLLEKAIELSLKQHPTNENLIIRKADFISENDYKEALLYLIKSKKLFNSYPSIILLTYQGAKILSREGKYKNALDATLDCLKYQCNEYILTLAAYLYLKLDEYDTARKYLIKAFEYCYNKYKNSKDEEVRSYGANDYMYSSTIIPDDLLYSCSELCKEDAKYKDIFYPIVEKFVEYDPQNTYYWEMLAEFYERCNEPEKALKACDYSLCNSVDVDMLKRKYLNYIACGEKKERTSILEKIIVLLEKELDKKDLPTGYQKDTLLSLATTYKEMINVCIEEQKFQECIDICHLIIKKGNTIPLFHKGISFTKSYIYYILSRLYLNLNNYHLAKANGMQAILNDSHTYNAKIQYAELIYMIGEIENATNLYQNTYEELQELIVSKKSNNQNDKYELEELYTQLTFLLTSWAKQLFAHNQLQNAFDLLRSLIAELFKIDFMEDNIISVILTQAEIVYLSNSKTKDLEDMIKGAIILYGDPIIDALSESPYIQNNKELILNFINLIQKHKKDEELL